MGREGDHEVDRSKMVAFGMLSNSKLCSSAYAIDLDVVDMILQTYRTIHTHQTEHAFGGMKAILTLDATLVDRMERQSLAVQT